MLNKIGKWLLIIGLLILSSSLVVSIWFEDAFENFPEPIFIALLLISTICFCISFSFIYYNSTPQKRKKAIRIVSIISSFILLFAIFSKGMRWLGASAESIISVFLFLFGCLPLIVKSRYEKRKTIISKKALRLSFVDLFAILFLCLGALFKFMHWTGWLFLTIPGCILLILSIIGWNISFRKEVGLRIKAEDDLKNLLTNLEIKNKLIEEKQNEILASIRYAKRIQQALLPTEKFIEKNINKLKK